MRKIVDRLKEPSSYAAIAGVLALLGLKIDADLWQSVVQVASGIAFIVAYCLPEGMIENRKGLENKVDPPEPDRFP